APRFFKTTNTTFADDDYRLIDINSADGVWKSSKLFTIRAYRAYTIYNKSAAHLE
ncbi:hypothetical protein AVEN_267872-1, partial [Araneus ventricosus]